MGEEEKPEVEASITPALVESNLVATEAKETPLKNARDVENALLDRPTQVKARPLGKPLNNTEAVRIWEQRRARFTRVLIATIGIAAIYLGLNHNDNGKNLYQAIVKGLNEVSTLISELDLQDFEAPELPSFAAPIRAQGDAEGGRRDMPIADIATPDLEEAPTLSSLTATSELPTPEVTVIPPGTERADGVEQNEILQDDTMCVGLGARTITVEHKIYGYLTMTVEATNRDNLKDGGLLQFSDPGWHGKEYPDSYICLVGIDNGDGKYVYNIPLDEVKRSAKLNMLNRSRDNVVFDTRLMQMNDLRTGLSYANDYIETPQGDYVAFQVFKSEITPATPVPRDGSQHNDNGLGSLKSNIRAREQRRTQSGIF